MVMYAILVTATPPMNRLPAILSFPLSPIAGVLSMLHIVHDVTRKGACMKAAYADPPYLGCSAKHYDQHHPQASDYDGVVAHRRLVERLCDEFDCWALTVVPPECELQSRCVLVDSRIRALVEQVGELTERVYL